MIPDLGEDRQSAHLNLVSSAKGRHRNRPSTRPPRSVGPLPQASVTTVRSEAVRNRLLAMRLREDHQTADPQQVLEDRVSHG